MPLPKLTLLERMGSVLAPARETWFVEINGDARSIPFYENWAEQQGIEPWGVESGMWMHFDFQTESAARAFMQKLPPPPKSSAFKVDVYPMEL